MKDEEITLDIDRIDERAKLRRINIISGLLDDRKRLLRAQKKFQMKLASIDRELALVSKELCKEQGHSYDVWQFDIDTNSYKNICLVCGKVIRSEEKPEDTIERTLKRKFR